MTKAWWSNPKWKANRRGNRHYEKSRWIPHTGAKQAARYARMSGSK